MIGGNIMGTVGNKQPFTFGLRGVAAVNREFFCPALSQDAVGALSEEERVALYGRGRPYLAAAIGVRRALTNGPWTAVTRWRLVGALSEASADVRALGQRRVVILVEPETDAAPLPAAQREGKA
jgi:hypothetical protein